MTRDYEALGHAAERGELVPDLSTLRQGEAAASEGRRLLLEASPVLAAHFHRRNI